MSKSRTKKSIKAAKKSVKEGKVPDKAAIPGIPFPPIEASDVDLAFPGNVARLMPPLGGPNDPSARALNLMNDWFGKGLKNAKFKPKKGINASMAVRHIKCILRSFGPKHEHKEEAVARLIDMWFDSYEWETEHA